MRTDTSHDPSLRKQNSTFPSLGWLLRHVTTELERPKHFLAPEHSPLGADSGKQELLTVSVVAAEPWNFSLKALPPVGTVWGV